MQTPSPCFVRSSEFCKQPLFRQLRLLSFGVTLQNSLLRMALRARVLAQGFPPVFLATAPVGYDPCTKRHD